MIVPTEWDEESKKSIVSPIRAHHDDGSSYEMPGFTEGDGLCHICGSEASTGVWRGMRTIQVCFRCALDTLPALIADALVGSSIRKTSFSRGRRPTVCNGSRSFEVMGRIEKVFWRAYAIALESAIRIVDQDDLDDAIDAENDQ